MSRIYVIELPDAAEVMGRQFLLAVRERFGDANLKCTMSFESWVKLNGYDKSVPLPAFLPPNTDPGKVHEHLKRSLTTPMDSSEPCRFPALTQQDKERKE